MPRSKAGNGLRDRLHEIIFEAETPAGRFFDLGLLVTIVFSVIAVMLESVSSIQAQHGDVLRVFEWIITGCFTIEYVLRLYCVGNPLAYARSMFGVVDLLAILPSYLSLLLPGAHSLMVIRGLRLLRVFRVLKLAHFVGEARMLRAAMRASTRKIIIFLGFVLTAVVIIGSVMYLIEGEESGFNNIPESIYWCIVTMTTVGYGDIVPQTPLGKLLASVVMILGYGIIAVPTGIVTVEIAGAREAVSTHCCPECAAEGHAVDAAYCKYCGSRL